MEEQEEEEDKQLELLNINTLPKDITFDIFSRIPLKNLCQLRCVCQKWLHYLCKNQEFRVFYHQKHKISPILLFTQQIGEKPSTKLSSCYIDGSQLSQIPTNIDQSLISIQTCNGILCLITKTNATLYDPITKQRSNLANSTHFSSTLSFSFGFLTFRNVFKLLHFYTIKRFDNFHYCQTQEVMCEILSNPVTDLGFESQKEWKFLGKCPFDNVLCRKNYAHVNGKFYWLIGEKNFNPDCIKIMSFNLEVENFGMIYFPSNHSVECLDLVEINERLCLTDRLPWESSMDVWMMVNEDVGFNNMWVQKYRIDLMGIHHHDVRILGHFGKSTSNNNDNNESEGELLVKFGAQSFGFYELHSGIYRDLASEINIQEKGGLQLMINRKYML